MITAQGAAMESNNRIHTQLLLEQWAKWRYYQSGAVLGYPREVPFYRLMRGSGVGDPYITDAKAERVDAAVARLCNRCPDQGEIVKLRYLDGKAPARIARELHIGETRARQLLAQGEYAIEWVLEMME
jgi:DNA-directed RNA polymerase specialized sigma24 family protein